MSLPPLRVPNKISEAISIIESRLKDSEQHLDRQYAKIEDYKKQISDLENEAMRQDEKDAIRESLTALIEFQYKHVRDSKVINSELRILIARMYGQYTKFERFCAEPPPEDLFKRHHE